MAEINHKWECISNEPFTQRCIRCRAERRPVGKASYHWFLEGEWKPMRVQPECSALPKSERR